MFTVHQLETYSLVSAVSVEPASPAVIPWLRRLFHIHLGNPQVRFAAGGTGHTFALFLRPEDQERAHHSSPLRADGLVVTIFPHNQGENAFTFYYRFLVCLTLEKFPLELWDRRGVASSVSGFASLVNIDHACLRGHDFAAIFVMVKVESLDHITHHLAFHKPDESGALADVYINEVWNIDSPFTPSPPPRPRHPSPPFRHRSSRAHTLSSSQTQTQNQNTQGSPSVPSTRFAPSSQNSRDAPEYSASLSRMGDRAKRSLHQNVNPNLFDLLAFLAHSNKVEFPSSFGHTPHTTVTFERGAFHICLELSPYRIIET